MERIIKSKAKCPKCKSNNLSLEELWINHFITWEQISGVVDRNDGNLDVGEPHKVFGTCKDCKHKWKFRNANQIDDVII